MLNRRNFLHRSSLVSLSPLVPAFLSQTAHAASAEKDQRLLVVVQLSGGNDGLNTVIPFADENYAKYRENLKIPTDEIIRLDDSLGLHPAMKAAGELFDDGRLAIVPGVGYPNPSRSHFRSMAVWHSARLDALDHNGQGWLGRANDVNRPADSPSPDAVFVGDGSIPAAIVGRRSTAVALNNEEELMLAAQFETDRGQRPDKQGSGVATDDLSSFLQRTVDSSFIAAKQFAEASKGDSGEGNYPASSLGRKLKLMAKLVRTGGGTRVFYVEQPGYDTHSAQRFQHERLLRELSTSLKAFLDDMRATGFGDRVTVLAFSEFGRRVEENASAGTDHGTSGPVFVAGESVRAGLPGDYPSLSDLDDGDLKTSVDFRSIYASLLQDWLQIDATGPLGGHFEPVALVM